MQVGHQLHGESIAHVLDNSGSAFREKLTLTVTVGADDASDRVVERHETEPLTRMTQRSFRPILPFPAASRLPAGRRYIWDVTRQNPVRPVAHGRS